VFWYEKGRASTEAMSCSRSNRDRTPLLSRRQKRNWRSDTAQIQQAHANLERDKRQAQNEQTQSDRYKELAAEGIVSREQYDQFRTNAEMAVQSLAADQAALEVARAAATGDGAAVERAAVDLDHCTIRSPIDGVAGYLAVQLGNLVKGNADTALVTINVF